MMVGQIKKMDEELQVVYGEVYAPNVPDSDGEFMTPVGVRKMAHSAMVNLSGIEIDINHNHEAQTAKIVESFIARKGDPDFLPESWVVGVHIINEDLWDRIKKGELNGFSLEALVQKKPKVLEIEVPEVIEGVTQKNEGHEHKFFVRFDDDGNFIGGFTDEVNGHSHTIERGTVTEKADGHAHRYSFLEALDVTEAEDDDG